MLRCRHAGADEETGQQRAVGVLEHSAHHYGAGGRVEFGRDVLEHAFMRVAVFVHQADLDRDFCEIRLVQPALTHCRADAQHVLLADAEGRVDRVDLDQAGELGVRRPADQRADRDEMLGHHTVERGYDLGVAEIDPGDGHAGLRVGDVALVARPLGTALLDGGL